MELGGSFMRKIKFRAWDKEAKQMLSVRDIDFCGEEISTYGTQGDWIGFDYVELMQYTGLKDKNGKEIYEGDVFIGSYGLKIVTPTVVKFGHGAFIVDSNNPDGYLYLADIIESLAWEVEVIGNIYESEEVI
jgi:uncharacterized phage protein (TIGR01671 family)